MKALLLLSGGIDSPVAGHLAQEAGWDLEAVHFSFEPLTDKTPEEKSRKLADILGIRLHVINISREIRSIADKTERRYYFVLMKRVMLKKAETLAHKLGCTALVTGESVGQVSSQTLDNLAVIDTAVPMPVMRPLIAMDKQEIVERAEKLGTFELTKGKEMCDILGPPKPATAAKLEIVLIEEKKL